MDNKKFTSTIQEIYSFLGLPCTSSDTLEQVNKHYGANKLSRSNKKSRKTVTEKNSQNHLKLTNDPLQLFKGNSSVKFYCKDILRAHISKPGLLYSSKEKKDSNIINFLACSNESVLVLNAINYKNLKNFSYIVPKEFSIESFLNAGRFFKETNQTQLCVLGQNSTWNVDNSHGIVLLNLTKRIVKVCATGDKGSYNMDRLTNSSKEICEIELRKRYFVFAKPGKKIVVSSPKFSVLLAWPYLPLIDNFLMFHKHVYLLKAFSSTDTPRNILPSINRTLIEQTDMEDCKLLEKLEKHRKYTKFGVLQVNDDEYKKFSSFGYTVSLETSFFVTHLCKCGQYINKWIFVKYLDSQNYENRCMDCLFNLSFNDEDYLLRRYKNYSYNVLAQNMPNWNFLYPYYEEAMKNKKRAITKKARIYIPLKKQCIEVAAENKDMKRDLEHNLKYENKNCDKENKKCSESEGNNFNKELKNENAASVVKSSCNIESRGEFKQIKGEYKVKQELDEGGQ